MDDEVMGRRQLKSELHRAVALFLEAENALWEIEKRSPGDYLDGLKKAAAYGEWLTKRAEAVQHMAEIEEELDRTPRDPREYE